MSGACDIVGKVVVEADDHLGETPVWSPTEQALYWINCENPPRLRRWDSATGAVAEWPMPERIGGLALRSSGKPVVCLTSGIYDLDPESGCLSLIANSPFGSHVSLHESAVDRTGRLWVGASDHRAGPTDCSPGGGAICRLDGERIVPMIPGISIANMLAFSPSGETLYFGDTFRRVIWAADIRLVDGAILGMREFIVVPEGEYGDGAAVDADGGYWLAMFGAAQLRRYRPNGILDHIVRLPMSQPTKATFGGSELRTLFITSSRMEVPRVPRQGANGVLYRVDTDIQGLAEEYFTG